LLPSLNISSKEHCFILLRLESYGQISHQDKLPIIATHILLGPQRTKLHAQEPSQEIRPTNSYSAKIPAVLSHSFIAEIQYNTECH
jgi:hypothetical protein